MWYRSGTASSDADEWAAAQDPSNQSLAAKRGRANVFEVPNGWDILGPAGSGAEFALLLCRRPAVPR